MILLYSKLPPITIKKPIDYNTISLAIKDYHL